MVISLGMNMVTQKLINMINPKNFGNSEKDPVYGYLENPRELIFIDMDGVLADAEGGMQEWSDKLGLSTKELFDKKLYHIPGFYKDLPPIENINDTYKFFAEKSNLQILELVKKTNLNYWFS